jgi:DNA-binding CsgD family transcriptional regulator
MLLTFVAALQGLGLCARQRAIAAGLARGAPNQDPAAALCVSGNTIAYHIKQRLAKLGPHDRQEMIGRMLGQRRAGGPPAANGPSRAGREGRSFRAYTWRRRDERVGRASAPCRDPPEQRHHAANSFDRFFPGFPSGPLGNGSP